MQLVPIQRMNCQHSADANKVKCNRHVTQNGDVCWNIAHRGLLGMSVQVHENSVHERTQFIVYSCFSRQPMQLLQQRQRWCTWWCVENGSGHVVTSVEWRHYSEHTDCYNYKTRRDEGVHQAVQTVLINITSDLLDATQLIVTGLYTDSSLVVKTESTVELNIKVTNSGLCRQLQCLVGLAKFRQLL